VESRKIPEKFYNKLYYTDNYVKWVNENICAGKFDRVDAPDPRIVIPFFDRSGKVLAVQGRTILKDPKVTRYITVKESSDMLVWGLDRVDITDTIYLFEGSLDAMFLDNSLAAAGSSLKKLINSELDIVFCFDRESRSREITNLMDEVIKKNRKIFIWDDSFDVKDINALVMKYNISEENLLKYIRKRTFRGLPARLEFSKFKKI